MKLKLYQVMNLNNTLSEIMEQKVGNVRASYKLYKIKYAIEGAIQPIVEVMKQKEDEDNVDEMEQLLSEEETFDFEKLTLEELENLDLSIKNIADIAPILEEGE